MGKIMNDRMVLDYKFSLFGDFSNLHKNVSELVKNPLFIKHSIERTDIINGSIAIPVYLFETTQSFLRIGNARIDFCFKMANSQNEESIFLQLFNSIKALLPTFIKRVAINYTFNIVDDDLSHINAVSTKINILQGEVPPKDFVVSQVFKIDILGIPSNNVINIQTGSFIDRATFKTRRALSCAFDINTIPVSDIESNKTISKEVALSLFENAKIVLNNNLRLINRIFN